MRYRIHVTVGAGHLAAVVEAACKDNPDPYLQVEPLDQPALPAPAPRSQIKRMSARPGAEPKPKVQRRLTANGAKRQEVLERTLQTGPKRWSELRTAIGEAGLPQGTLNSLISKWQTEGKIQRSPNGLWSLVAKHEEAARTIHD
jgi:hypothetical protein